MEMRQNARREQYYTRDHEWINFQDTVAYIGVCRFKLTGFRQIQELKFMEASGFKKQGEVIATVRYNDYLIALHMPVDGNLVTINEKLVSGNPNILLDCAESTAWMALIEPSVPQQRKDLLPPKQYQASHKRNHSK
jgi:glycine cleavage system H protein